jgi:hypothetical protein
MLKFSLVAYSLLLLLSHSTLPQTSTSTSNCFPHVPVPIDRWRGEYFNNPGLAGAPVMVRDDGVGELDFDWGLSSPAKDCGINVDRFSARWTRTAAFAGRTYRFTIASDDGVRLLVDGTERFSSWRNRPYTTSNIELEMAPGNHIIQLEYFENFGSATVSLSWAPAPCTAVVLAEKWKGEYFNNPALSGKPTLVRDEGDGPLNFFWGLKSPDSSCNVSADNFSARWSRTVTFADGLYRFTVTSYDRVRIYLDRELKFERAPENRAIYSFDLPLSAGNHEIMVEYIEGTGNAGLMFEWERHSCFPVVPPDHWRGEYFNNRSLSGEPVMVRDMGDGTLNFDASVTNSDCSVSENNFSARWSRRIILGAGLYRFNVTGDDGVRFYVNGKRLINQWRDQKQATYSSDIQLPAGTHRLVLEYYNHTGEGVARVSWEAIGLTQSR